MVNALQGNNNEIKGPFFEVKDQAGRTRATILGTNHCLPRDLKLCSAIREAFSKSDALITEQDPPQIFEGLWTQLKALPSSKYPKLGCLDLALFRKAQQEKKETLVLEQTEFFNDISDLIPDATPPTFDEQLNFALKSVNNCTQGTLEGMEAYLNESNSLYRVKPERFEVRNKIIVADRNIVQAEEIDRYLNRNPEKTPFITLGIGHLPDMSFTPGVVTLLQQKGWSVVQVK